MSFGWSAGDIVVAIHLVSRIVKSVGNVGGARESFQELESELLSLSKALHEINAFTSEPGQPPEIVALKFVACLCEDTLKRFYERIKPFDTALGAGSQSRTGKGKAVPRMVRWELLVKKDIPELRSYLAAHVGSLNLRLNTALLKLAARSLIHGTHNSTMIQQHVQDEATAISDKIRNISEGDTIPRLESLLTVATNVWKTQTEMMEKLSNMAHIIPKPDIQHTWAQTPVRFEDALGRVIPIPSEYDWDKVEAVIQGQFKRGPGQSKVRSGEYELFNGGLGDLQIIREQNFCPIPGMSIIMAFVVGQYAGSEHCPRPGCKSRSFKIQGGSDAYRICSICDSWFRTSRAALPTPLKPPNLDALSYGSRHSQQTKQSDYPSRSHQDRRTYKNLSIYVTELPPTPENVFQNKYPRMREPELESAWRHIRYSDNMYGSTGHINSANRNSEPSRLQAANKTYAKSSFGMTIREDGSEDAAERVKKEWATEIEQDEVTLEEMAVATLDPDFGEELKLVKQWFEVLSHGEQSAAIYGLSVQTTPAQIRFLTKVLWRVGKHSA